MRSALIADLHANREAVEAVLAHARGQQVDNWVFLGDFVGYGADPGWVVDVVRAHVQAGAIAVQGNHDQAVVQGVSPNMNADARRVVDWTRARLDNSQIAFLAGLPMTAHRDDQLFVHANAWRPGGWAYVQGRADALRCFNATQSCYTFCGHTHEPRLYNLSATGKVGEFIPIAGVAIPVPSHRQWLAIPGSAGQPRDGNPAACYAVFDDLSRTLMFHRVPYDHEEAGAKIRAAELPQRLAARLEDGH